MKIYYWIMLLLIIVQIGAAQPYEGPDTLWTRVHELPDFEQFSVTNVVLMPDGGVMLSGNYATLGEIDVGPCLARLDSGGNLLWLRPAHDSTMITSYPTYMCRICPDLLLLAAPILGEYYDPCVTLCNEDGTVLGQRAFRMPDWQYVHGVCPSGDGGATVIYHTENLSTGTRIMCAMKVDMQGNSVWNYSYPNPGEHITAKTIIATADSGFLLLGSGPNLIDVYPTILVKIDADGHLEYSRSYRFPYNENIADDVTELTNGDYVICGCVLSYQTVRFQAFILRVNPNGDSLWSWLSDPDDWMASRAVQVLAVSDGGFVIRFARETQNSNKYMHFSATGSLLWQREYVVTYQSMQGEAVINGNSSIMWAGETFDIPSNRYSLVALKTYPDPAMAGIQPLTVLPTYISLHIYPNPFNSTTQIEFTLPVTKRVSLRLYDILGREVTVLLDEMRTVGEHRVRFDGNGLSSGVYFCRMEAGRETRMQKIVLMK